MLARQAWLAARGLELLEAGRVQLGSVGPRLTGDRCWRRLDAATAVGGGRVYRYCLQHGLVGADPTAGVARARVDPDYTATLGLSREQGRALIAAADADRGRDRLRSAAVIRLLLHNALRVDEVLSADVADLGADRGASGADHPRQGHRRARVPLSLATVVAVDAYLDDRAHHAGGRGPG